MSEPGHRFVEANGIRIHIAETGTGPLVLLLHGFPECWYSWRHQLRALGEAGFHAVAPDQRGYCRTDRPEQIDQYTIHHLVGDAIGLMDALGDEEAVVVGHDWGAPVAWHTALMRPDRIRGVIGLSVPYRPRPPAPPLALMRKAVGDGFYQLYFQKPGTADAELARDPRRTFGRVLYSASGDAPESQSDSLMVVPPGGGFLDRMVEPKTLPGWLTEEDIDTFAREFEDSGFTGGLNWYRNIDRNWELTAPWQGARVQPPALYVAGDRDLTLKFPGGRGLLGKLGTFAPNLRPTVVLSGCGHWTQQERPEEVNAALIEFLSGLREPAGSGVRSAGIGRQPEAEPDQH
jgi:pimeloyl-ACP methyl ester carboxylesterase